MPYLIKDFARTVTPVTSYSGVNVSHDFYSGPSNIGKVIPEDSSAFYQDLKSMLQTTTLSITFEDETNSFYLFGIKFTIYCVVGNYYSTNDSYYSVIPVIYRNKDYSNSYPFTRNYYSSTNSTIYKGCGPQDSICVSYNQRQSLGYRIRIHYNTNFLHISYGPRYNLNFVLPVMCAIKGLTIESKDIVYLSGDCNTSSIMAENGTFQGEGLYKYGVAGSILDTSRFSVYHSLVYPDKPDLCLIMGSNNTTEVRNNTNSFAIFENLKNTQYVKPRIISDTNQAKFLKRKAVTIGNMIDFDNVLIADDIMTDNSYYDVAGDTYFCPGTSYSSDLQYSYPYYYYQASRLLLKI